MRDDGREDFGGTNGSPARVTVDEAAHIFGTTDSAIRKRLSRGTLRSEKGDDGRVFVLLDGEDVRDDAGDRRGDFREDAGEPKAAVEGYAILVENLKGQVEYLRSQLAGREEEARENRRIIAGLIQRVPELEAAPDAPQNVRETHDQGDRHGGRQAGAEEPQRGFWSRLFGG